MATDELFDDKPAVPPTEGKPEGGEKAPGEATDLAAQLASLRESVESSKTETGKEAAQSVLQTLQGLAQLRQQQAAQEAQGQELERKGPEEDFQELYQDPKGLIAKIAAQVAAAAQQQQQAQLGPYLKQQAEQTRDTILDAQTRSVDEEWGDGAWKDLFQAPFQEIFDQMPLEMQASKDHVEATIGVVLSKLVRDQDAFGKLQEKKAEMTKKRESPPVMLGGSRPRAPGAQLNGEEKEFIASLKRSGFTMDPKEYIKFRDQGWSEDMDAEGATQ